MLTGSTRFDALPRAAQSLTGRIHFVPILPFSQGELAGVHEDFLDVALTDPTRSSTGPGTGLTRTEYAERVCAGGMPIPLQLSGAARIRWFDDYTTASLRRDATEISRIRRSSVLTPLLARIAGQTAQVLNITKPTKRSTSIARRPTATSRCSKTCSWFVVYRPGVRHSAPAPRCCPRCTSSTPGWPRGCCG